MACFWCEIFFCYSDAACCFRKTYSFFLGSYIEKKNKRRPGGPSRSCLGVSRCVRLLLLLFMGLYRFLQKISTRKLMYTRICLYYCCFSFLQKRKKREKRVYKLLGGGFIVFEAVSSRLIGRIQELEDQQRLTNDRLMKLEQFIETGLKSLHEKNVLVSQQQCEMDRLRHENEWLLYRLGVTNASRSSGAAHRDLTPRSFQLLPANSIKKRLQKQ